MRLLLRTSRPKFSDGHALRWTTISPEPVTGIRPFLPCREKIQPLLAHASASAIAKQIGVSRWYQRNKDTIFNSPNRAQPDFRHDLMGVDPILPCLDG